MREEEDEKETERFFLVASVASLPKPKPSSSSSPPALTHLAGLWHPVSAAPGHSVLKGDPRKGWEVRVVFDPVSACCGELIELS